MFILMNVIHGEIDEFKIINPYRIRGRKIAS